jgi:hypothetical protein
MSTDKHGVVNIMECDVNLQHVSPLSLRGVLAVLNPTVNASIAYRLIVRLRKHLHPTWNYFDMSSVPVMRIRAFVAFCALGRAMQWGKDTLLPHVRSNWFYMLDHTIVPYP